MMAACKIAIVPFIFNALQHIIIVVSLLATQTHGQSDIDSGCANCCCYALMFVFVVDVACCRGAIAAFMQSNEAVAQRLQVLQRLQRQISDGMFEARNRGREDRRVASFLCPINGNHLMVDPVKAEDGRHYDRSTSSSGSTPGVGGVRARCCLPAPDSRWA